MGYFNYVKSFYFADCKIFELKTIFPEDDHGDIDDYFFKKNIKLLCNIKEKLHQDSLNFKKYLILKTGDFRCDYFIYNKTVIICYNESIENIQTEIDIQGHQEPLSFDMKIINKKKIEEDSIYYNHLGTGSCLLVTSADDNISEEFFIPKSINDYYDIVYHEQLEHSISVENHIQ